MKHTNSKDLLNINSNNQITSNNIDLKHNTKKTNNRLSIKLNQILSETPKIEKVAYDNTPKDKYFYKFSNLPILLDNTNSKLNQFINLHNYNNKKLKCKALPIDVYNNKTIIKHTNTNKEIVSVTINNANKLNNYNTSLFKHISNKPIKIKFLKNINNNVSSQLQNHSLNNINNIDLLSNFEKGVSNMINNKLKYRHDYILEYKIKQKYYTNNKFVNSNVNNYYSNDLVNKNSNTFVNLLKYNNVPKNLFEIKKEEAIECYDLISLDLKEINADLNFFCIFPCLNELKIMFSDIKFNNESDYKIFKKNDKIDTEEKDNNNNNYISNTIEYKSKKLTDLNYSNFYNNLKKLSINYSNLNNNIFKYIISIKKLEELSLVGNLINERADFDLLIENKHLKLIDLSNNKIKGKYLEYNNFSNEDINLKNTVEEKHKNSIFNNNYLKYSLNSNLSKMFLSLSKIKLLKSLNLSYNNINCIDINLNSINNEIDNVFDNLEFLDISYNNIKEELDILNVINFKNLNKLDLSNNPICLNTNKLHNLEYEIMKNKDNIVIINQSTKYKQYNTNNYFNSLKEKNSLLFNIKQENPDKLTEDIIEKTKKYQKLNENTLKKRFNKHSLHTKKYKIRNEICFNPNRVNTFIKNKVKSLSKKLNELENFDLNKTIKNEALIKQTFDDNDNNVENTVTSINCTNEDDIRIIEKANTNLFITEDINKSICYNKDDYLNTSKIQIKDNCIYKTKLNNNLIYEFDEICKKLKYERNQAFKDYKINDNKLNNKNNSNMKDSSIGNKTIEDNNNSYYNCIKLAFKCLGTKKHYDKNNVNNVDNRYYKDLRDVIKRSVI